MEIQELTFFYLHENTSKIEVQFRLNTDSEDEIRTDYINLNDASDFGYDIIMENNNNDIDEDEDEFYWLDSPLVDEDILLTFLNEYYIIHSDKLPKPELV